MPIKPGYSYARVQENIARLIKEGHNPGQAIAIAFSVARKAFWHRHPEGALPEWLTPIGGKRLKNPAPKLPQKDIESVKKAISKIGQFSAQVYDRGLSARERIRAKEIVDRQWEIIRAITSEHEKISKNPVPPSRKVQLRSASKLYENFTGHDAEEIFSVDKPAIPDVMLVIGNIDGVMYSTVRDGVAEKYIHKFKKSCRPLFAVSHDGKQLFMLGGAYNFTERGIVDHSK